MGGNPNQQQHEDQPQSPRNNNNDKNEANSGKHQPKTLAEWVERQRRREREQEKDFRKLESIRQQVLRGKLRNSNRGHNNNNNRNHDDDDDDENESDSSQTFNDHDEDGDENENETEKNRQHQSHVHSSASNSTRKIIIDDDEHGNLTVAKILKARQLQHQQQQHHQQQRNNNINNIRSSIANAASAKEDYLRKIREEINRKQMSWFSDNNSTPNSKSNDDNNNNNNKKKSAAPPPRFGFGRSKKEESEPGSLKFAFGVTVFAIVFFCLLPFVGLPLLQAARRKTYDAIVIPDFSPFPVNFNALEYFSSDDRRNSFKSQEESKVHDSPSAQKRGWLHKVQERLSSLTHLRHQDQKSPKQNDDIVLFDQKHVGIVVVIRGGNFPVLRSSSSLPQPQPSRLLPFGLIQSLAQVPNHMPLQIVFSLSPSASKRFESNKKKFHKSLLNTLQLGDFENKNNETIQDHPLLGFSSKKEGEEEKSTGKKKHATLPSSLSPENYLVIFSEYNKDENSNAKKSSEENKNNQDHHLSQLYEKGLQQISPSVGTVLFLSDSISPVNPQTFILQLIAEFAAVRPFSTITSFSKGINRDNSSNNNIKNNNNNRKNNDKEFFEYEADTTSKYLLTPITALQCGVVHNSMMQTDNLADRRKLYQHFRKRALEATNSFSASPNGDDDEDFPFFSQPTINDRLLHKKRQQRLRIAKHKNIQKANSDNNLDSRKQEEESHRQDAISRQIWHELYSDVETTVVDGGWQVAVSTPPGRSADALAGVALYTTWHGFSMRSAGFHPPLLTRDEELARQEENSIRESYHVGADEVDSEIEHKIRERDDDDDDESDNGGNDDDEEDENENGNKKLKNRNDNDESSSSSSSSDEKFVFANAKVQDQKVIDGNVRKQKSKKKNRRKEKKLLLPTVVALKSPQDQQHQHQNEGDGVAEFASLRASQERNLERQLIDDAIEHEADELPVLVDALGSNCIIVDRKSLHDAGAFTSTKFVQSDIDQLVHSSRGWDVATTHLSQLFLFDVTTVFMSLMTTLMGKSVTGITIAKRRQARACVSVGVDAVGKFEEAAGISTAVLAMRWGVHNRPWRTQYSNELRGRILGCENNSAFVDIVLCYCDMVKEAGKHLEDEMKKDWFVENVQKSYPVPDATVGWALSLRLRSLAVMKRSELEKHRSKIQNNYGDKLKKQREEALAKKYSNNDDKNSQDDVDDDEDDDFDDKDLHNTFRVGCSRNAVAFFVIPPSEATTNLVSTPQWAKIFFNHVVAPSYQLFSVGHNIFGSSHKSDIKTHQQNNHGSSTTTVSGDQEWLKFVRSLHPEYNRVISGHHIFDNDQDDDNAASRHHKNKNKHRKISIFHQSNSNPNHHRHHYGKNSPHEGIFSWLWSFVSSSGAKSSEKTKKMVATWNKPWQVSWTHRHSMLAMFSRRKHSMLISNWKTRGERDSENDNNNHVDQDDNNTKSDINSHRKLVQSQQDYFDKKEFELIPGLKNDPTRKFTLHTNDNKIKNNKKTSLPPSYSLTSRLSRIFHYRHGTSNNNIDHNKNNNNHNNNNNNENNHNNKFSNNYDGNDEFKVKVDEKQQARIDRALADDIERQHDQDSADSKSLEIRWGRPAAWTPHDLAAMPFVRVVWFAICCGCCGFSAEIAHFTRPLSQLYPINLLLGPDCFCPGYESGFADTIGRAHLRPDKYSKLEYYPGEVLVWISHTDPLSFKRMDFFHRRHPSYVVGRSMYEFTRVPVEWQAPLRRDADEIWVPSEFVFQTFLDAGTPWAKMRIVPEGVDTSFFDPAVHRPMRLGKRVNITSPKFKEKFGIAWDNVMCNRPAVGNNNNNNNTTRSKNKTEKVEKNQDNEYIFFSQFKWEPRKGWRVLFESYFRAFMHKKFRNSMKKLNSIEPTFLSRIDSMTKNKINANSFHLGDNSSSTPANRRIQQRRERMNKNTKEIEVEQLNFKNDDDPDVALIILSILYAPDLDIKYKDNHDVTVTFRDVEALVADLFPDPTSRPQMHELPRFCMILDGISERAMAQLFRGADAFVLPTRGEGWGLPTMQAMAMGLPVISTNWGGSVDFTTKETSFLIELEGLDEIAQNSVYGWREGKKWATPSVRHLTKLLRHVYLNREHAMEVGQRAREFIVKNFDDFEVVRIVDQRLQEIAFSQTKKSFWK